MQKTPDSQKRTVSARFPKNLVKQLKALAGKERRSVSSLLEVIVEKAVKEDAEKTPA